MTIQTLIDRFDAEQPELINELQDLILRTNSLTKDEKKRLEDFHSSFVWDIRFLVECEYQPSATSTCGHYSPGTLEEFLSFEEGECAEDLTFHDLDEVFMEDFEVGEVITGEKSLRVYNFRLRV